MLSESDISYIAGLFDGEGSIHFKRGTEKKKKHTGKGYRTSNSLRLSMEITMTPYAHTKLPKIQQVIDHYGDHFVMNGNIINLEEYKKAMSLE